MLDPDLHVFDWKVLGWSMKTSSHGYGDFDDPFDRVSFNIDIERSVIGSALKIFLPIVTIASVAFVSTLIHDPREQRKASGTALIGMVLFWIGLNTLTPSTNYLTLLDKVLVLIYVLIGWILVCSVLCQKSDERQLASGAIVDGEKSRATIALRRATIVGFPLLLIIGTAVAWATSIGR